MYIHMSMISSMQSILNKYIYCLHGTSICSLRIHIYQLMVYYKYAYVRTYVQQARCLGSILLVTPRDNKIHDKISSILYVNNKGHVRVKQLG